jgi:beta-RFAP synthase
MSETIDTVTIVAPARLHLGFLDLHGGLGRRYGGLGLTLDGIHTRLRITRTERWTATGPSGPRASTCAQKLAQALGIDEAVHVEVEEAIPEHVGLGSGTQLSLAVAAGFMRLFPRHAVDLHTLASLLQRGVRSGIGLGAFEVGGFIVDGGCGQRTVAPPVIAQLPFPSDWPVLLIFDPAMHGLNGSREVTAFKALDPMAAGHSAELCRLVLMQVLPAIVEHDFDLFSRGVTAIQNIVGDYFAGCQGGRYTSGRVAEVLRWAQEHGIKGVGQSSWGPTGFAFAEDRRRVMVLLQDAEKRWGDDLQFKVCTANNRGADVTPGECVGVSRDAQRLLGAL